MTMVETINLNYNNHFPFIRDTYQNPCFKINPNIFKTRIPKYLQLKESVTNIESIYTKLLSGVKIDTIEISENIKKIARVQLGITIDNFKPLCHFQTDKDINIDDEVKFKVMRLINNNLLNELALFDESKQNLAIYLKNFIDSEIISSIGLNRIDQNLVKSMLNIDETNKPILVYGKNLLDSIILNKYIGIFFCSNYIIVICMFSNVVIVINNSKFLVIKGNSYALNKVSVEDSNLVINSILKTDKIYQITKGKTKDDNTVEIFYKYKNNLGTNIFTFHKKFSNGDEFEIYNKNGLLVQTKYNWASKVENIISQCTITDEKTGLRYRGKVEIENKERNQVSKKLSLNDETQYEKSGEQVLVDKLSNLRLSNEMIIGWKAVKNANGEKRILKLGIPSDARTVIPIDEEYYLNNQKERADQAIVMDIQIPDEQDEISVVPHETVAYSYVYSNGPCFEYKIGQLVKPDGFNDNPDIGCSQGIHFFRSKANLYKSYINL